MKSQGAAFQTTSLPPHVAHRSSRTLRFCLTLRFATGCFRAAEEEWRPFAERTRQIFRFLAEHREPGALAKYEERAAAEFAKTTNK